MTDHSMHDDTATRERTWWPWIAVAVVAVLAGVYVAAALFFAHRIPANTRVGGVEVGGMSEEDAAAKVEADLDSVVSEPVPITVAGTDITAEVDAARADVAIDGE